MRKLNSTTFVTLDGIMQGPGGPEEDRDGGFDQGGWSVNYWDETMMPAFMTEAMTPPFDMLLGRKTYEIFAGYWPTSTEAGAEDLNNARKYVASHTLTKVDWQNSTLLQGDVVQAVRKLKEENGPPIWVHGSSNLLQTLIKNDLIDQFRMLVFPVVIGKGKRLFDHGTVPAGLKLVDGKTTPTGVFLGVYEPAGSIPLGTFAA